jgi:threonine synthase
MTSAYVENKAHETPQRPLPVGCAWCRRAARSLTGRCVCGGHLETGMPPAEPSGRADFFGRWRHLLPVSTANHPRLALESPLVRVDPLRRSRTDPAVYLKLDCLLPTGSTKDRAAAGALAYLHDNGVRALAMSSTGNTSTAFAHYARYYPSLDVHIFTGRDFMFRVRELGAKNVTVHVVDGSFVQAGAEAKAFAEAEGMCWEGGFYNPGRRDGLKTAYLEAVDQLGVRPSMYVQAVSSAMGPVAVEQASRQSAPYRGLYGSAPDVSLLCVQQRSCAPMARTWFEGLATVPPRNLVANPRGIAKAILRGDPTAVYPSVRRAVLACDGDFAVVGDAEIRAAQQLVWDAVGLSVCEASAAAVAGYLEHGPDRRARRTNRPVVINITGQDRCEIRR